MSKRVGKEGRIFTLWKLKTMRDGVGPASTSLNDPRITRLGRFLRKYKLDEIPQILNILKGEMGIVGPRPEVEEVVALMTQEERDIILSVKPGLTDLASLWNIHEEELLRDEPDPHKAYLEKVWSRKKELQIEYIKTRSLWLDLRIILETIRRLL